MKIILKNVTLLGYSADVCSVVIDGSYITGIHKGVVSEEADSIIDCRGNLLMPGFYNTHCHPALTALRGYVDDVFPGSSSDSLIKKAEEKMDSELAYTASMLGICDMLRTGTVSFSDMYYFSDDVATAAYDSGIKANISRKINIYDDVDIRDDIQFVEARRLVEDYHEVGDDRVKCEFAIGSESGKSANAISEIINYAKTMNVGLQLDISKSKAVQEECMNRNGSSPVAMYERLGAFDLRATAVHCNWCGEKDFEIISKHGASISRCGISNLKLGYGMISLSAAKKSGVNITFGTGSALANNRYDMFREMRLAALLQRSSGRQKDVIPSADIIAYATRNGAVSQGRTDCGEIKKGNKADLIIINKENYYNQPSFGDCGSVVYGCDANDVMLTMVDGRILYQQGEFKAIDIEQLRYRFDKALSDM